MNLLNFLKKNLFIQNFVGTLISFLPPYLENTISKYEAIKKAFFITAHDDTFGDYLEFGVFTGSSFNFAIKANRRINRLFEKKTNCNFYGFDSFEGFGEIKQFDVNPSFKNKTFVVNKKKVLNNIKKIAKTDNYKIIEGYYDNTLNKKNPLEYGIKKSRIIMIDCDLKESTKLALDFILPSLQLGTIILFDDYHYYKGDITKGEYGAFEEFKQKNPNILFRTILNYGYAGIGYIVAKI